MHINDFRVGHWSHPDRLTGCTVVIAPDLVPAAVDVRGGAPGTRETDLLGPGRMLRRVDAVLLTGGSAFGLEAASGVMKALSNQGRGFPTAAIPVPIVAGAVIYDLVPGNIVWPESTSGYMAAMAASGDVETGPVGAGCGASVSKMSGRDLAVRSGIGIETVKTPAGHVTAVIVNNAFGDVFDPESGAYRTTPGHKGISSQEIAISTSPAENPGESTVIGAILVHRSMDADSLSRVAVSAQAGIAQVIRPAHSIFDGDTIFAVATGDASCSRSDLFQISTGAQLATRRAILGTVNG
jgi:L-aminopeptidase/D-esterase-like protein